MNIQEQTGLIVGGGPVGLSAALFLRIAGHETQVIETAERRSTWSRALAINPRTLELLESTKATERLLSLGLPIRSAMIWNEGLKLAARLDFSRVHPRYPYLLALSQSVTEEILEDAFVKLGGKVLRGHRLESCELDQGQRVRARVQPQGGQQALELAPQWLLAADGAHSAVRRSLAWDQPGTTFAQPWRLLDVPLETSLDEACAHIFFIRPGELVVLIRVVKDRELERTGPMVWRIFSNSKIRPEFLPVRIAGQPLWESQFHIAHRICDQFSRGNVYLAGDAAHLHSPIGARGMNLGIEDAWAFGELLSSGRISEYSRIRHTIDSRVVRRIHRFSQLAMARNPLTALLRERLLPRALSFGPVSLRVERLLSGMDHSLSDAA